MRLFGPRKCLLLLNALAILFFFCFFYLRTAIPFAQFNSYVDWKRLSFSDYNASSSSSSSSLSSLLSSSSVIAVTKLPVHDKNDDECIRNFLSDYRKRCEAPLQNSHRLPQGITAQLCPCIPDSLVGFVPINETVVPSLEQLELDLSILKENGRWRPAQCTARQRLAIIIPYADRDTHLRIFLNHMHPFLQRQHVDYSIFIIEQLHPELFNRAMLMNVGFVEANATGDFDCFIFHDIDQLPIDDRNFYVCSELPRHVVGYRKKFNYNYAYATSFGGGNSFTRQQFELINGYSNSFYGWGGEDDDLYQRTEAKKLRRTRFPRCIAKYDEVKHDRDRRNPMGANQQLGFKFRPDVYKNDGLNSLNYSVISTESRKLFTKISVRLADPPPSQTIRQTSAFPVTRALTTPNSPLRTRSASFGFFRLPPLTPRS